MLASKREVFLGRDKGESGAAGGLADHSRERLGRHETPCQSTL